MPNEKEIRTKISSVKNTQKITKAMEMVAAGKMRRAQERMKAARPYAEKIRAMIEHVSQASLEYRHPWLEVRDQVKNVGFIIVTTDRGLCGGLNINLFKRTLTEMKQWEDRGAGIKIAAFGSKGISFFKRHGQLVAQRSGVGDAPRVEDLIGTVKVMLDAYEAGEIDRLFLVENRFIGAMTQSPQLAQLLPVEPPEEIKTRDQWDYIYEPEAKELLGHMLTRYIEMQVWHAVVENIACEMAARMVAMKSASDNAAGLIDDLQLAYNKARQAAITQEISEIVGGAAAV